MHFPVSYQYILTATPHDSQVIVDMDLLVCFLVVHLMGDKYGLLDEVLVPEPSAAVSGLSSFWLKRKLT